jgi:ion channel POLLUX/CASTOR
VHEPAIRPDPEQVEPVPPPRDSGQALHNGHFARSPLDKLAAVDKPTRHPLSARLRYAFDNYMAKGTIALIFGLFVLSVLVILVITVIVLIAGLKNESPETEGLGFFELFWRSLLRTLDPGTMGGDTGSVAFLLSMLAVTMGGIFIVATLIGVISSGIEGKLDELRKGHSKVLESNHTVILGWTRQVFDIIGEIVLANENQKRAHIVVLADRDKVEMEEEIRQRIPDTKTTRIICRSGSPLELGDLATTSVHASRSVIILAPETDDPDTEVIKTLLAITNDPQRRPEPYRIVAEIREPRNVDVARLASGGEAQLVLGGELIGRIAAQTCRAPGLSIVYQDLLDFGGDEMYFWSSPEMVGRKFGECLALFRTSSLIGIIPVDGTGAPQLNPPMDRVIAEGDRLVIVSQDDDTITREEPREAIREDLIVVHEEAPDTPDATLVLGWNSRTANLLVELDKYVAAGSRLMVIAQGGRADLAGDVEAVGRRLKNLKLTYRAADTTDRQVLDEVTSDDYGHVVVVSYSDDYDEQRADAKTLVTLLHLRDIEAHRGESYTIVSEMLDVRNRALAAVTQADDFIVSGKLVSLMMSQLAENPDLRPIFDDMFDEDGSELYLKPAADYVKVGEPVDFFTVLESARRRGQIAFGYRLLSQASDPDKNYGVFMNPDKAQLITFTDADKLIVISEE